MLCVQGRFTEFMQAMQAGLEKVGKRFVVDISSRWGGDIVGALPSPSDNLLFHEGEDHAEPLQEELDGGGVRAAGPDYLAQYAATGAHVMDMEPYYGPGDPNANQFGKPEPRNMSQMQAIIDGLTAKFPLPQIGVAVGTVELPGHANASCGQRPDRPPIFSSCVDFLI